MADCPVKTEWKQRTKYPHVACSYFPGPQDRCTWCGKTVEEQEREREEA